MTTARPMRVLVTGAAGFLGSHVAEHLIRSGHEVTGMDDLSGGFRENLPLGVRFIDGTITDQRLVDQLFESNFDYVFHLAAYAAEGLSHHIRAFNYTNNVLGSMHLINASIRHDVRRFIFTSSIAVYGSHQSPMVETMVPQPEDPYGIAKLAVELDLKAAHQYFGLDYTIFRPHNVYGERQNIADRYRNVVGIFMNQIMRAEPLTIFGDGAQTRAFSHVDDVAPLIAKSIVHPNASTATFNVGADTPYSVRRLAAVVASAMGSDPEIRYLPARNEVTHAFADHSLAKDVLDHHPSVPLEVGIGRMARWARSVGPRPTAPYPDIELSSRLPEGWESTT